MTAPSLRIDTPRSLASLVAQRLRDAIVDGQFPLGSLIAEESLAQSFGVSRTPVREALNQLQRLGVVAIRPQRGSFVFVPTEDDIAALCEFRCVIEPQAVRLALRHDRAGLLASVRAAIDEMADARRARDPIRYGRADTRLHEAFVAHCGNPYLQMAYETAATKIATLRTHLSAPADVLGEDGFAQHRRILALLEATGADGVAGFDGDAFDALLRLHVTGTRDAYVAGLRTLAVR